MTTAEQLEEFRNRLQEVDLPTLRALDRELHLLLKQKEEGQPQSAHGATAQEEFRRQYPRLAIDRDLFALVGIQPATPVEEDKMFIREQIVRRLAE